MNRENSNICVQIMRSNNFQVSVEHSYRTLYNKKGEWLKKPFSFFHEETENRKR